MRHFCVTAVSEIARFERQCREKRRRNGKKNNDNNKKNNNNNNNDNNNGEEEDEEYFDLSQPSIVCERMGVWLESAAKQSDLRGCEGGATLIAAVIDISRQMIHICSLGDSLVCFFF